MGGVIGFGFFLVVEGFVWIRRDFERVLLFWSFEVLIFFFKGYSVGRAIFSLFSFSGFVGL